MSDTFAPDEHGLIAGVYCSVQGADAPGAAPWIASMVRSQSMDFHRLTVEIRERLRAVGDAVPRLELGDMTIAVGPQLVRYLNLVFDAAEHGQKLWVTKEEEELTPEQVAEQLGVSRPFVYRLLDRGELPSRRVGNKHRRVPAAAVAEFMQGSQAKAAAAERLVDEADLADGVALSAQDLRTAARNARETGDTEALKKVLRARQLARAVATPSSGEVPEQ
jgi:excisionase family DNA binding protein